MRSTNEMSHEEIQNLLQLRKDGGLAADVAHDVDAHLKTCADCRAYGVLLDGLTAGDWNPHEARGLTAADQRELVAQILPHVRKNHMTKQSKRQTKTFKTYGTAFAMLALFIIGGALWGVFQTTFPESAPSLIIKQEPDIVDVESPDISSSSATLLKPIDLPTSSFNPLGWSPDDKFIGLVLYDVDGNRVIDDNDSTEGSLVFYDVENGILCPESSITTASTPEEALILDWEDNGMVVVTSIEGTVDNQHWQGQPCDAFTQIDDFSFDHPDSDPLVSPNGRYRVSHIGSTFNINRKTTILYDNDIRLHEVRWEDVDSYHLSGWVSPSQYLISRTKDQGALLLDAEKGVIHVKDDLFGMDDNPDWSESDYSDRGDVIAISTGDQTDEFYLTTRYWNENHENPKANEVHLLYNAKTGEVETLPGRLHPEALDGWLVAHVRAENEGSMYVYDVVRRPLNQFNGEWELFAHNVDVFSIWDDLGDHTPHSMVWAEHETGEIMWQDWQSGDVIGRYITDPYLSLPMYMSHNGEHVLIMGETQNEKGESQDEALFIADKPGVIKQLTAESPPVPTPPSVLILEEAAENALINTDYFERFGVSGQFEDAQVAYDAGVRFRNLFTWGHQRDTELEGDVTFWQTLRVGDDNMPWDWDNLNGIIADNPGSYWIVGNEPDVRWQDNVTPQQYAERYHEAYTTIKAADPTAQIVAGSISQATPLRLQWLDEVLRSYQALYDEPFPADLWSIHGYTLREEPDSWGVDIPPGIEADTGELYEIEDHDDLDLFTQNLLAFRRWMAANGYDVPLAVTEFGILLPFDFGFPPDDVAQYMQESLDILLTLEDESGYSQDNNRVAQFWFWYIIEDAEMYSSGSLYDSESGEPTSLGEAWIDYLVSPPNIETETALDSTSSCSERYYFDTDPNENPARYDGWELGIAFDLPERWNPVCFRRDDYGDWIHLQLEGLFPDERTEENPRVDYSPDKRELLVDVMPFRFDFWERPTLTPYELYMTSRGNDDENVEMLTIDGRDIVIYERPGNKHPLTMLTVVNGLGVKLHGKKLYRDDMMAIITSMEAPDYAGWMPTEILSATVLHPSNLAISTVGDYALTVSTSHGLPVDTAEQAISTYMGLSSYAWNLQGEITSPAHRPDIAIGRYTDFGGGTALFVGASKLNIFGETKVIRVEWSVPAGQADQFAPTFEKIVRGISPRYMREVFINYPPDEPIVVEQTDTNEYDGWELGISLTVPDGWYNVQLPASWWGDETTRTYIFQNHDLPIFEVDIDKIEFPPDYQSVVVAVPTIPDDVPHDTLSLAELHEQLFSSFLMVGDMELTTIGEKDVSISVHRPDGVGHHAMNMLTHVDEQVVVVIGNAYEPMLDELRTNMESIVAPLAPAITPSFVPDNSAEWSYVPIPDDGLLIAYPTDWVHHANTDDEHISMPAYPEDTDIDYDEWFTTEESPVVRYTQGIVGETPERHVLALRWYAKPLFDEMLQPRAPLYSPSHRPDVVIGRYYDETAQIDYFFGAAEHPRAGWKDNLYKTVGIEAKVPSDQADEFAPIFERIVRSIRAE